MDSFLQELKREQTGRGSGSGRAESDAYSDVDPHTTNLYVANLPTAIDEKVFGEYFAQYGAIASVGEVHTWNFAPLTLTQGQNTMATARGSE